MATRSTNSSSPDSLWLVKSGDRITGPFTTEEIASRIESKDIVVLDEISRPQSRWRYVRDEPVFALAVEEMRKGLMQTKEDTEIQGHTQSMTGSKTPNFTSAQTMTDIDSEMSLEDTPALAMSQRKTESDLSVQDAEFVDVPHRPRVDGGGAWAENRKPHRKSAGVSWTTLALALVVCTITVYFAFNYYNQETSAGKTNTPVGSDNSHLLAQASHDWDRGEFDKALRAYREAGVSATAKPEVALRLAVLLMQQDGSTVEAKRVLQDATAHAIGADIKRDLLIARGLAALRDEDMDVAKGLFREALQSRSSNAEFDLGMAFYLTGGAWKEALDHFRASGDEPWAQYMVARTLINGRDSLDRNWKELATKALDSLTLKNQDFRQEALVLEAYIDVLSGQKKSAWARVKAAFETDPDQTQEHFHDPLLALNAVNWKDLLPFCQKVQDELNASASRAMLAVCMTKAAGSIDAEKLLSDELIRAPQDEILQAANAYVMVAMGRDDSARAALKVAARGGSALNSRLGLLLSARLCSHEGEKPCGEETWSRLAAEPSPPLSALVHLAEFRAAGGDKTGAGALLVKAQEISPRYLPLIRVRQELSEK